MRQVALSVLSLLGHDIFKALLEDVLPICNREEGNQDLTPHHHRHAQHDLLGCGQLADVDGVETGPRNGRHDHEQAVPPANAVGWVRSTPEDERGHHSGADEVGIVQGDVVDGRQIWLDDVGSGR